MPKAARGRGSRSASWHLSTLASRGSQKHRSLLGLPQEHPGRVAELADAADLGSAAARRRGSSPLPSTDPKRASTRSGGAEVDSNPIRSAPFVSATERAGGPCVEQTAVKQERHATSPFVTTSARQTLARGQRPARSIRVHGAAIPIGLSNFPTSRSELGNHFEEWGSATCSMCPDARLCQPFDGAQLADAPFRRTR